ncbi:MAG: Gfo/Idh/MocA family oxidoreductase [Filifactor alocis]|nr:Gfo/Idh/MocA family oxidoreductase [Filifactor alocis]
MEKIRIGILGTSEIAFRRFLPALMKCKDFDYVGVASRTVEKTGKFVETYGGRAYSSYEELLDDEGIDAVYIPLPPALHYQWATSALEKGKHVFLEKPSTTALSDTRALIAMAEERDLVLRENYMFLYHGQIKRIQEIFEQEELGELRLLRSSFGFPKRSAEDFRYNKELGGGSLLDCGGYPVRLILELLGEEVEVETSKLYYTDEYEVDLYGDATLSNGNVTAQIGFGMDHEYRCELELWGSRGYLKAPRIFTAPPEFDVEFDCVVGGESKKLSVGKDDQFYNSIVYFRECILDNERRIREYTYLEKQSYLVEKIQKEG